MKNPDADEIFDIVVIGAGVVGCSIARRFTLEGAKVAIVEKATDILDGASKANSAILHTGFDAPTGSLELQCVRSGYQEYAKIHRDLGLPLEMTGAHVVAWNEEEMTRFEAILEQAHANGIMDVKIIAKKELRALEPGLSDNALAAISVPGEAIIDPWSAPYTYLRQALKNGAQSFLSCEVQGGTFETGIWRLQTSRGSLISRHVINCAGLYGDKVNEKLLGRSAFDITPRKGQFVVFDKAAHSLVNSVILPVPSERTKGIVIFQTVFGNLAVGPTAEDQKNRKDASTDKETLQRLIDAGVEKIPGLKHMPITAVYAGLRPATQFKDYQIELDGSCNWITVAGIRSTGLSGALGIASHVYNLYVQAGNKHERIANPKLRTAPVLIDASSAGLQRDWQKCGHGEIVCHCELVTKREIETALEGNLAARSLAGLKRQTRVTMGRCQGFYCSARLAELTDGHFGNPIAKKFNRDEFATEKPSLSNGTAIDVAIIGGGPSGLSAAIELKRLGYARIVVLERESAAGGIPRHCGHPPFGLREFNRILTGPDYAKKLVAAASAAKVEIFTKTTVVEARPGGELLLATIGGTEVIRARRVIYATGVRETPRSTRLISGNRISGILNTGALQSMVYLKGRAPFKRPVIIGTELVSFSAIATCRHARIKPVAMVGESDRIVARWPYSVFPRWADIAFRTGLRLLPRIMGMPLHLGAKLVAIDGDDNVSSVQIELADGVSQNIDCDGVILTGKFTPESALARSGHLKIDPATAGPIVDQFGRCSDPVYFATGNLLRPVETADWCWNEGRATARMVSGDLENKLPDFNNIVRVCSLGPVIKYVMPQILQSANASSGMKYLQLRFQKSTRGYLVGTAGKKIVFRRKMTVHPEYRIVVPLSEFANGFSNEDIQLTFEEL